MRYSQSWKQENQHEFKLQHESTWSIIVVTFGIEQRWWSDAALLVVMRGFRGRLGIRNCHRCVATTTTEATRLRAPPPCESPIA